MTPLREQLSQARTDYRSQAYPGDLSAELLVRRPPRWFRVLPVLLGGGLAASLVVAVSVNGFRSPADVGTGGRPVHQAAVDPAPSAAPAYAFDRVPLSLPSSPLMAASPPVTVSWVQLNELGQQQYEQIAPKLRQTLTWPSLSSPTPKPSDAPATQRSV